ncbi:MAG: hypothetical protein HY791_10065 [Deltaproteobacteria bacterium]|nr:hypothetical protein [Deltaproteobacteria bacterium]
MDGDDPPRWLLIRREAGVPDDENSGARFSVDHLFVDHRAIPTLVEVKRSSDSRIRREVVGQMLDYAANAAAYWGKGHIRAAFEAECAKRDLDVDARMELHIGDESVDEFWEHVDENLEQGKLRLLFVADEIPRELQTVVEFLNKQMTLTQVLAVAITQYRSGTVPSTGEVFVPRVLGNTAAASRTKQPDGSRRTWTRESFIEEGTAAARAAYATLEQLQKDLGGRIAFGTGVSKGSGSRSDRSGVQMAAGQGPTN